MIELARTRPKTRAEQESEVERVYRTIKTWLLEARLPPGDFLSELDLATRCKTSRTPIREAFSRLAQDGWLTRIRRKGYLVTPISIRDIVELYEYRKVLECFVVDKVAQSSSHEQTKEWAAMVGLEEDPDAKLPDIRTANSTFPLRPAELSANQRWRTSSPWCSATF